MHQVRKGSCFCGARLMTSHPRRPLVDVYAATVPTRQQEPTLEAAAALRVERNVDETILP